MLFLNIEPTKGGFIKPLHFEVSIEARAIGAAFAVFAGGADMTTYAAAGRFLQKTCAKMTLAGARLNQKGGPPQRGLQSSSLAAGFGP